MGGAVLYYLSILIYCTIVVAVLGGAILYYLSISIHCTMVVAVLGGAILYYLSISYDIKNITIWNKKCFKKIKK